MAYTTNDNGQEFFQAHLYTGTGDTSATLARTFDGNVDLNPGLLYMFKRTGGGNMHNIMTNEILGEGYIWLSSGADSAADGILDSFDSDGYTHATANQGSYYHNENAKEYGVWAWKNMAASSVNNTDGTITSSVRTDANLGLSYVRWTGTSVDGTIGHGLGKRPKAIWLYPVQVAANNGNTQRSWWWEANTDGYMICNGLNESQQAERNNVNGIATADKSGEGTTSVFTVKEANNSYEQCNHSSQDYLALVWTDVQGFSKFGSYIGNGNANGTFVYTGFKPALIMIRGMHATGTRCFDYRRDPDNRDDGHFVGVNDSQTEISDANTKIDILSNGFKIRCAHTGLNAAGNKYGFCAWAQEPVVTSTGVPTTAR
jgi:hypothetical protein